MRALSMQEPRRAGRASQSVCPARCTPPTVTALTGPAGGRLAAVHTLTQGLLSTFRPAETNRDPNKYCTTVLGPTISTLEKTVEFGIKVRQLNYWERKIV